MTVTVKLWLTWLLLVPLFMTVTVMVAVPAVLGAGARIKVPVVLGLEYFTEGAGMSVGSLELAVTVNAMV